MTQALNDWIDFIQKPRPELGNFAVCPYAKQATEQKAYRVEDITVALIHEALTRVDLEKDLVTILVVKDYASFSIDELVQITAELNKNYRPKDFVVLDNDPRTPMIINGVTTTFAECYLWIIQSLVDLNKKSQSLSKTNYYTFWTQKQLDEVVTWRT